MHDEALAVYMQMHRMYLMLEGEGEGPPAPTPRSEEEITEAILAGWSVCDTCTRSFKRAEYSLTGLTLCAYCWSKKLLEDYDRYMAAKGVPEHASKAAPVYRVSNVSNGTGFRPGRDSTERGRQRRSAEPRQH